MGALTSNRKRGDEFLSLNYQSPYHNFQVSKRPKLGSMQQSPSQNLVSSNRIAARISRYPESKPPLKRQVHAPCRPLKFGFAAVDKVRRDSSSSRIDNGSVMGSALSSRLERAKQSAFNAIRYFRKDPVIDVDDEGEKETALDDSSVEEVEVVEDGRYWRPRESNKDGKLGVDVVEIDEKDVDKRNFSQPSSSVVTDANNMGVGSADVLRVENAEKMLDSLSLSREGILDVEVYKKLLESAQKRDPRLEAIGFEINLNEKRRDGYRLLHPVKQVEEVPREPFAPLTKEEESEVECALSANRRKVLVSHSGTDIDITGQILQCLRPGSWLNDEVINVYLGLLKEREKREPQKFLKCHFFNTFFYNKLASGNKGYDFRAVKRWTTMRKLGYALIDCDKIFVPIHKQIHWCLAVINRKDQKFQYLDSLKGTDGRVLNNLARYYVEEVKDKSGKDIDISHWEHEFVEDLPEQENGYDCGVFMLKYIDFYSRDIGLCFDQSHMPYFRLRTAKEILRLRAD